MNAEDGLERPYQIRRQQRDDGDGAYWFATVEELPGCMSDGDSEAEALASVRAAMHGWIGAALDAGRPIPRAAAVCRREAAGGRTEPMR